MKKILTILSIIAVFCLYSFDKESRSINQLTPTPTVITSVVDTAGILQSSDNLAGFWPKWDRYVCCTQCGWTSGFCGCGVGFCWINCQRCGNHLYGADWCARRCDE